MSADTNAGFSIQSSNDGRVAVVAVSGELDITTAPALATAIQGQIESTPSALIIDLSAVSFLASAAMTVLATTQQDHGDTVAFSVVADGPTTSRPIKLMGLDQEFALHADLASARAALD
ncbi:MULTISPECIES: STAS domain-containing protein [Nocardiaceae]|uniref:STAS domain-containing protein n=1 Tax=Rhodococcoides yunnanense TaxID=278209 RepID=A0ABU4B9W3_9NOCA|nr:MULTISPECIES: STAS domain-containing protein [Rhodococcus]MDI9893263.1 STAS domain-containing protein [Rhodococcus sp. IEGM 1381]MDV6260980.1 STAS domain-containing protein [Rhodococcus yunnanensis]MDV8021538.1 STAS domain-containing protein [Rhodococcus sp. IEGM 1330]